MKKTKIKRENPFFSKISLFFIIIFLICLIIIFSILIQKKSPSVNSKANEQNSTERYTLNYLSNGNLNKVITSGNSTQIVENITGLSAVPYILKMKIRTENGSARIIFNKKIRDFSDINWQEIEMLIVPQDIENENFLEIISSSKDSNFNIEEATLNELNMTGGIILPETYEKNSQNNNSSSVNLPQSIPKKDYDVSIGMSYQVVVQYCNNPNDPKRKIDSQTNRCQLVEDLAKRDLVAANNNFIATEKKLNFKLFEKNWDQNLPQLCIPANLDFWLSWETCSHPNSDIYFGIFLSKSQSYRIDDEGASKPEFSSVNYGLFDQKINSWEDLTYDIVLSHELGHLFGQVHEFTARTKEPHPLSHLIYDSAQFFKGDLSAYARIHDASYDWVVQMTKHAPLWRSFVGLELMGRGYYFQEQLPNNILLTLYDYNHEILKKGNVKIYATDTGNPIYLFQILMGNADTVPIGSNIIYEKILAQEDNGIIKIPGSLFYSYPLLLISVEDGDRIYYTWMHVGEANLAFWNKLDNNESTESIPIQKQALMYKSLNIKFLPLTKDAKFGNIRVELSVLDQTPHGRDWVVKDSKIYSPVQGLEGNLTFVNLKFEKPFSVEAFPVDPTSNMKLIIPRCPEGEALANSCIVNPWEGSTVTYYLSTK